MGSVEQPEQLQDAKARQLPWQALCPGGAHLVTALEDVALHAEGTCEVLCGLGLASAWGIAPPQ